MPNFTKKAIIESFMKLLDQKPLSQITVKDIVEDCGINRNSFYYHFQDIPSLLEEVVTAQADAIISENASVDSIEQCLNLAIGFALDHKRAALHMYNSGSRDTFEQHLMRVCEYVVRSYMDTAFPDAALSESDKAIIIRFYKCECFGQIIEWMSNGMRDDLQASYKRLCALKRGMAEELIERASIK